MKYKQKACKAKTENKAVRLNKALWDQKGKPLKPLSLGLFCVGICFRCGACPSARLCWRKLVFPLRMVINRRSLLTWDGGVFTSPLGSGAIWFRPVQALHVLPQSLGAHMHAGSIVFRMLCVLSVCHAHWLSQSLCLLFCSVAWAPRGGIWRSYPS